MRICRPGPRAASRPSPSPGHRAMFRTTLSALAVILIWSATAPAQPTGYEGFDYPTGTALNGLNGGTGWAAPPAGAWSTSSPLFTIGSGSLSPPSPADSLGTTGNRLVMPATADLTTASRTFGSDLRTVSGDASVWVSFVITRTAGDTSGSFGGLVIGNEAGTSNSNGRVFI